VLNYLSAKAGLIIVSDANLQAYRSQWSPSSPIGTNEIVDLLNEQLSKNDLTAVLQGRTLQSWTSRAPSLSPGTPVRVAMNPNQVTNTDEVVTEILPGSYFGARRNWSKTLIP